MELGYTHTQQSAYDASWTDPKLDSTKAAANDQACRDAACDYWIEIDFAGNVHYVNSLILMKRGDKDTTRTINQIQIEYSVDGTTWLQYQNGDMIDTGQTTSTLNTVQLSIDLTPF
jgi:hypothetical protein